MYSEKNVYEWKKLITKETDYYRWWKWDKNDLKIISFYSFNFKLNFEVINSGVVKRFI